MAQIELKYTIPYQSGATPQNGSIVDIILTYDANTIAGTINGVNYYRATAATGSYQVLGPGNTVLRTDTITGISPVGTVGGNDNYIRPSVDPIIQSGSGLSFAVNVPTDGGYGDGTTNVYRQGNQLFDGGSNTQAATNVSSTQVCFVTGTLIRTARGEVAVEDLKIGDLAVTASGAHRPIRWIGQRTLDPRRHPRPHEAQPVRIRAHAFGESKPARDLLVSPGHAIALDILGEVLVPACALVNGATIVQEAVDSVTYWHVELDSHDLLVAENLPAESYLDMGNRRFFAHGTSGAAVVDLASGPDAAPEARTHADYCRPFHTGGVLVEAVRARLKARAEALGWRLEARPLAEEVRLVADGRALVPEIDGLTARFLLPAGTQDVRLVSGRSVPAEIAGSSDRRELGLVLVGLSVDDGANPARRVALDDPRLGDGFHPAESAAGALWRWTDGAALLPAALWSGTEGAVTLRLDLYAEPLQRWHAPEAASPADGSALAA